MIDRSPSRRIEQELDTLGEDGRQFRSPRFINETNIDHVTQEHPLLHLKHFEQTPHERLSVQYKLPVYLRQSI